MSPGKNEAREKWTEGIKEAIRGKVMGQREVG